jgi:MYXO-CTERM domain-containing protein
MSFSWGSGEGRGNLTEEAAWTHPGIGLFAATGDSGFQAVGSYPATSAAVVAVGGTTLMKSAGTPRGWVENAWNGGGSGCSTVIPKPPWQTDMGCAKKTVADISAIASNVATYCTDPGGGSNGWGTVGGTSAASPFATGALAVTGIVNGNFDPSWVWKNADRFYDITTGSNGTCTPAYVCKAGAGYDGPTGVGSPNGDLLTGGGNISDAGAVADGGGVVVDSGARDGGAAAGSGGAATGSTGTAGTGTISGASGSGGGSSVTGSTGGASSDRMTAAADSQAGCSCKVGAGARRPAAPSGLVLFGLLAARARRRRERS